MELQFDKKMVSCLQNLIQEVQNQEQTQEVKLNDSMPDIGRVLGAWGQVLLRGKEWYPGEIGISGGIMAWVLYIPEDGGNIQCVEAWMPFQTKFNFGDIGKDGTVKTKCILRSIDARSTSARRLMIRAGIGVECTATVNSQIECYCPEECNPDIQLLRKKYPLKIPREAGEKQFALDSELTMPNSLQKIHKLLHYTLKPEISDCKVVSGKGVFRGVGNLHILYLTQEGEICTADFELPFSQYTDLNDEYAENSEMDISPVVTNLEIDVNGDDRLHVKASIAAQHTIYATEVIEMVVDSYSPHRVVNVQNTCVQVPAVLDSNQQQVKVVFPMDITGCKVLDICFYPDYPVIRRSNRIAQINTPGVFQMLYIDQEGTMQSTTGRAESQTEIDVDEGCSLQGIANLKGKPYIGNNDVCADIFLTVRTYTDEGFDMVSGIEYSEPNEADDFSPSMILQRVNNATLWDIAKSCGSTVDAIVNANQLQGEPNYGQMLLIPVV